MYLCAPIFGRYWMALKVDDEEAKAAAAPIDSSSSATSPVAAPIEQTKFVPIDEENEKVSLMGLRVVPAAAAADEPIQEEDEEEADADDTTLYGIAAINRIGKERMTDTIVGNNSFSEEEDGDNSPVHTPTPVDSSNSLIIDGELGQPSEQPE